EFAPRIGPPTVHGTSAAKKTWSPARSSEVPAFSSGVSSAIGKKRPAGRLTPSPPNEYTSLSVSHVTPQSVSRGAARRMIVELVRRERTDAATRQGPTAGTVDQEHLSVRRPDIRAAISHYRR